MLRALQSVMEMEERTEVEVNGELVTRTVKGLLRFPDPDVEPEMRQVKKEFDFYTLKDENIVQDTVMTAAPLAYYALLDRTPEAMDGDAY